MDNTVYAVCMKCKQNINSPFDIYTMDDNDDNTIIVCYWCVDDDKTNSGD